MATSRRAAAAPVRTSSRSAPASTARRSSGFRGAEGRRKMEEEEERAAARREASSQMAGMPFRYFRPPDSTPGEYIIVDDVPDFFRYEHNLKDERSGKWSVFCACIADHASCPVCKSQERPSYFAMFLTIIDLTPYEDRDGNTVEWSKKLLVVKPAQQKKFTRLFERHGTLRGMLMQATRDGEKDAAIGNDQEFVEFVPEEELLSYESQYTDKKGKVHDVIGHEVFDYDELFPEQTEQMLRALVGGKAEPGSREDTDRELGRERRGGASSRGGESRAGRGSGDGWEDRPARRGAPVRRGRDAEEEAPAEEDVDDAPAPVRVARSARTSAPARRAPTRTAARDEEPDEDRPQRRGREPVEEDESVDDEPARKPAMSLAERRRALRR